MCGEIRLLITLLDSRYDEKYSRCRSLFFYRSGMTTGRRHSRAPTRYFRDSGNNELGTRESSETCRRQPTPYAVIPATAGIQYNMSRDSRLIMGFLDSRYDEKYGRYRSLFFYRSRMTHF